MFDLVLETLKNSAQNINFRYPVLNLTGAMFSSSNAGFILYINETDSSPVLDQTATSQNDGSD